MPETREELMQIYKIERPKFLQPKQHKKSYARHQVKYSLRRPYTWAAAITAQEHLCVVFSKSYNKLLSLFNSWLKLVKNAWIVWLQCIQTQN